MDGAQGQLNLIITDESLEEDDRRNITTNKHSAARTAVEQGADANPCFKVLKFLCKFCDILLDIGTECHGLKRRLTNEIMGLNTESNSRSLEKPEQTGRCVCLQKNIGGVHNIFNDNTKNFLLDRDDIKQCLIALRTQSVSEEILDAVKVLMSNAKKRPPSSELGNATKKKKVATKNQTAKKKTVPKKSST